MYVDFHIFLFKLITYALSRIIKAFKTLASYICMHFILFSWFFHNIIGLESEDEFILQLDEGDFIHISSFINKFDFNKIFFMIINSLTFFKSIIIFRIRYGKSSF